MVYDIALDKARDHTRSAFMRNHIMIITYYIWIDLFGYIFLLLIYFLNKMNVKNIIKILFRRFHT